MDRFLVCGYRGFGSSHNQNELPPHAILFRQTGMQFRSGPTQEFLVHLGQFSRQDESSCGKNLYQQLERIQNAVRRLVEHTGFLSGFQRGEQGLACSTATGKGAFEAEPIQWQPGCGQSGNSGARTWNRNNGLPGVDRCANQGESRIGNKWGTRVGYKG